MNPNQQPKFCVNFGNLMAHVKKVQCDYIIMFISDFKEFKQIENPLLLELIGGVRTPKTTAFQMYRCWLNVDYDGTVIGELFF